MGVVGLGEGGGVGRCMVPMEVEGVQAVDGEVERVEVVAKEAVAKEAMGEVAQLVLRVAQAMVVDPVEVVKKEVVGEVAQLVLRVAQAMVVDTVAEDLADIMPILVQRVTRTMAMGHRGCGESLLGLSSRIVALGA